MTYALLIYRNLPPGETLPEAEDRAILRAHGALQVDAAARSELHAVARLGDLDAARTVRRRAAGSAHEIMDGPHIETKEWLVGFYLLDCATEAEALARASTICDAHHAIEVRPVTWRWQQP